MWPNFFIVGTQRAATTSLYEYLKLVPSIYMSPVKEPHYFSVSIPEDEILTKPIRDKSKYLKLFENVRNEVAIGEATPMYLWDPKSPKLIHDVVPNAKIIMILRDPVERAFSHYLSLLGTKGESASFEDVIKRSVTLPHDDFSGRVTNAGLYAEQVKRYLDFFGTKQVMIIIFEEFEKNTKLSVKQILEFLGVKDNPPDNVGTIYNQFTVPRGQVSSTLLKSQAIKKIGKRLVPSSLGRLLIMNVLSKKAPKPPLPESDRKFLQEFYRDDVKKLQNLLGRTLPWFEPKNQT